MSSRSVSVVIEWDNVRLSELDRARRMLSTLAAEAARVHEAPDWATPEETAFLSDVVLPLDVLVTFDSTEFTEAELREVVDACLPAGATAVALRTVPVPGGRYYALKNAGAQASSGEYIIFLDSDAVPEPGWLSGMLTAFADPDRRVVGGNTYIEPTGIYGKTFALAWFFQPRLPDGPPVPVTNFLANNVGFHRGSFLPDGFDLEEGLSKGACQRLSRRLIESGTGIWRAPRAHCSHPPPNGVGHFVERAIAHGRDMALGPAGMAVTPVGSLTRFLKNQRSAVERIIRNRERVNLSVSEVPVSVAIAATYYTLFFVGEAMSHAAPGWMRRNFQL
jgi:hypothetical protein